MTIFHIYLIKLLWRQGDLTVVIPQYSQKQGWGKKINQNSSNKKIFERGN